MPKVSVILSSYNHEAYVAQAIESVLNQTFKDFELLIYDDGSKDKSADIIRSFHDDRIKKFLYPRNRGPLEASKEPARMARGEYIAIHHSDDVWAPDKLEKQVRFMDEHLEYAACFTLVNFIDEAGDEYVPQEGSFYRTVFKQSNKTRAEWLRQFFFHGNCLCHPSLLMRRDKYDEYDLIDTEGFWQLPDFYMWVKLSLHETIYVYQETLTKFRLRRGKQTQQGGERAEVSIRSQFELYKVLQLYRTISQKELMLEIFPETSKYLNDKGGNISFALAMMALQIGTSAYQMLALDILYELVRDKVSARELRECYRYTWKNFIEDTGREDVFHTCSILNFLNMIVYAKYKDGSVQEIRNPNVYLTQAGMFFSEFILKNNRNNLQTLQVEFCNSKYEKISIRSVYIDGQITKVFPINADNESGEYDTFCTTMPRYTIESPKTDVAVLRITGKVDLKALLDVEKILEDRKIRLEDRKIKIDMLKHELAEIEERLGQNKEILTQREEELQAIKETRGWRMLEGIRRTRDQFKQYITHGTYNCLMNPMFKRFAYKTGDILKACMPSVYEKVYLFSLSKLKPKILSYSLGSQVSGAQDDLLWKVSTQIDGKKEYLVSVIVPNYNHAPYLKERLDSIYNQTYEHYEVILLDDYSTDNSREILREYKERYSDKTRLVFNEKNSGNVFAQWKKGLSTAKGELIWIAESDDWCEPNFLEKMVKGFYDESVMLAFCRSDFMQDGVCTYKTEFYLQEFVEFDWTKSFSVTAAQLVAHAFSVKNIIPNVSSAVFRKPCTISRELEDLWMTLRLCGDWAFYLEILKGGGLFYTPEVTNFYRVHATSTSLKIQKEPIYYEEHERIARMVARNYNVPGSSHERHLRQLEEHYISYFGGNDRQEVSRWFHLDDIRKVQRLPNVLMCLFSMTIGGGETFPLALANELKNQGIPVTVLDFQMAEDMPGIRSGLRNDVPYVRLKDTDGVIYVAMQLRADIAHSHHGSVDEAVHYAVQYIPELKQVITLHGMYESTPSVYLNPLLKKVQKTCQAFVYIADKNLVPFIEYGGFDMERFVKIGNGLAFSTGTPIPRSKLGIPEDAFVLCVVSRAIPEKGWKAAIDAVTYARKKVEKEIHLILVGGGEMYDHLLRNVPDYIHLMGFQSNVRDYFATSDMGLLPSEFKGESFPLMIIDCLFSGKPVITSNLGESRNQLLDENGELAGVVFDLVDDKVPVELLGSIIAKVADDSDFYEQLKQRVATAAKKFMMEGVTIEYQKVYERVLAEGR